MVLHKPQTRFHLYVHMDPEGERLDVPSNPLGVMIDAMRVSTFVSTALDDDATVTSNTAPMPLSVGNKRTTETSWKPSRSFDNAVRSCNTR